MPCCVRAKITQNAPRGIPQLPFVRSRNNFLRDGTSVVVAFGVNTAARGLTNELQGDAYNPRPMRLRGRRLRASLIRGLPSASDNRPEPRAHAIDVASATQARTSVIPAASVGIKESIRLSIFMLELALASARTMSERTGETATNEEVDRYLSIIGDLLESARTQARGIPDPDGTSGDPDRRSGVG